MDKGGVKEIKAILCDYILQMETCNKTAKRFLRELYYGFINVYVMYGVRRRYESEVCYARPVTVTYKIILLSKVQNAVSESVRIDSRTLS